MLQRGFKKLLAEANAVIDTISVNEAAALVSGEHAVLVDVREAKEREQDGGITGSVHAARGFLEFHADPEHPMHIDALSAGKRLILYCATGGRSALAAKTLHDMGVNNVCHIAGGISAWKEAGGAMG